VSEKKKKVLARRRRFRSTGAYTWKKGEERKGGGGGVIPALLLTRVIVVRSVPPRLPTTGMGSTGASIHGGVLHPDNVNGNLRSPEKGTGHTDYPYPRPVASLRNKRA
jgi:hypothetical protein